tara:strand:- start:366 stop:1724 length:1359 start_codon:yes stop_codon:yes gene_type:complete
MISFARRIPNALVFIAGLILFAQLISYVLPAGEYDRDGDRVIAGTYQTVEAAPLSPIAFLTAIPKGLAEAQDIIFFVFIVGGAIGIVRATGVVDALISSALRRTGEQPEGLVAVMVGIFALGSSTIGMAEEYLPFVPILVTMCLALKLDAVVAVGIIYIGAGVGYACAALNPFTVLIAQDIAAVPLTSGQSVRWLLLLTCVGVGVHHLFRYMSRLRADPHSSFVADVDYEGFTLLSTNTLTSRHGVIIALLIVASAGFVWGVATQGWYVGELSSMFLAIALATTLIGGLAVNTAAQSFLMGAAEMTTTALLIGFARAIQVVLTDAQVIDTVIYGLAQPLALLPAHGAAVAMLGVQTVCNLFVPSGSAQAYVTMPVMAPLADLTEVTRQTAVLAYQFGDGFTNMIVPTNALLMGILALGRIPYSRWVQFVAPLLVKFYGVAIIALILAVQFGY